MESIGSGEGRLQMLLHTVSTRSPEKTRSHTKGADALGVTLQIFGMLRDTVGQCGNLPKAFLFSIFVFPQILVTPKSQKIPNHANTQPPEAVKQTQFSGKNLGNTQPQKRKWSKDDAPRRCLADLRATSLKKLPNQGPGTTKQKTDPPAHLACLW